ncbi:hypothetical protein BHM03_00028987 [Ensete ventricosum]|nr:hypothetical protein BHM03_00028987 [Ensete ventricosum]
MRRRLTSWENDASSPHGKTRRRLILARGDEATPHPCAGRRGVALLPGSHIGRRMVPPDSGRSAYRYPVQPVCNFDQYCLVRAVHTGPPGYRFADRSLPGGSVKNRSSTAD